MVNYKKDKPHFSIIKNLILIIFALIAIIGIYFVKKISAENNIRSLAVQIAKYDSALNSFTQKYHALPGDIQETIDYGITKENTGGNGDNIITDALKKNLQANGEITKFWLHLSQSKMIDENYDGLEDENAKVGNTFPLSKVGKKIGILSFSAEGKTFYQIGFNFSDSKRIHMSNRSLKSEEAFLLDQKIDDGEPYKGRIMAAGGTSLNIIKNDECVKFSQYNRSIQTPSCQLRIEAR